MTLNIVILILSLATVTEFIIFAADNIRRILLLLIIIMRRRVIYFFSFSLLIESGFYPSFIEPSGRKKNVVMLFLFSMFYKIKKN